MLIQDKKIFYFFQFNTKTKWLVFSEPIFRIFKTFTVWTIPFLLLGILFITRITFAMEGISHAPVTVQIALSVKVLAFNKNVTAHKDLKIQVIGNEELRQEFQKLIGKNIGTAVITTIVASGAPDNTAHVIIVDDPATIDSVMTVAKSSKITTMTCNPSLIEKGPSLSLGIKEDSPAIFLNSSSSKETGQEWENTIIKIATLI